MSASESFARTPFAALNYQRGIFGRLVTIISCRRSVVYAIHRQRHRGDIRSGRAVMGMIR